MTGPGEHGHDRLARGADLRSEVDQLLAVLAAEGPAGSVVGFGPETHRYLAPLGQAGFRVTAADPDPPAGRTFDAALVLGSALGGLVANDRMLTALARYAGCLRPGGLMLLDLVDGQTVLGARLPGRGLRELAGPDGRRMIGYADEVDTDEQVYRLTVRTWRLAEDRVVDRSIVVRDVRYFLPRELAFLLSVSGFELAGTAPLAGQPDPAWLRLAWARKA